jgi:dihydroflavonol-4-reductase
MTTTHPICVTGASGFIGSRVVEQLLARGHRVRATVRNPDKTADVRHLTGLPGAADRLELVKAELLTPGSFDAAVAGCEWVVHTASPYVLHAKDPQKDLVDPAVQGTENLLEACVRARSVRRVVQTSSMAAITDEPDSERMLTEADWNDKSSLDRNPYYFSKTLAERAAWRFVYGTDSPEPGLASKVGFELVVINPFLVVGPSLSPTINTSNQMFIDMLAGTYPGIMNLTWGFVDVRDVALAHVLALETENASGRYICANTTMPMRELVELLDKHGWGEGRKLPKMGLDCGIGDYAVRLSSYLQPKGVGSYLRTHVGRVPRFDHGKIVRELGLEFRPLDRTILDTLEDLQTWGHLPAKA